MNSSMHLISACQPLPSKRKKRDKGQESNVTCPGSWLLVHKSETCFLVLDSSDNDISFYDSENMCSLHNASVITVDISDRVKPSDASRDLKSHMLIQVKNYKSPSKH